MRRTAKSLSQGNRLPRLTVDPITPLTRSRSTDHLHKPFGVFTWAITTNKLLCKNLRGNHEKTQVYLENYIQEKRGIIWRKTGAWRMKEVRRNKDRTRCLIWSKE
jgi:hypothetical protein